MWKEIGSWNSHLDYNYKYRFTGHIPHWLQKKIPHYRGVLYERNRKKMQVRRFLHEVKDKLGFRQASFLYLHPNKDQIILKDRLFKYRITFGEGDEGFYGMVYRRQS